MLCLLKIKFLNYNIILQISSSYDHIALDKDSHSGTERDWFSDVKGDRTYHYIIKEVTYYKVEDELSGVLELRYTQTHKCVISEDAKKACSGCNSGTMQVSLCGGGYLQNGMFSIMNNPHTHTKTLRQTCWMNWHTGVHRDTTPHQHANIIKCLDSMWIFQVWGPQICNSAFLRGGYYY